MCTDQRGLDALAFLTICYINVRYLLLPPSVLNSPCIIRETCFFLSFSIMEREMIEKPEEKEFFSVATMIEKEKEKRWRISFFSLSVRCFLGDL